MSDRIAAPKISGLIKTYGLRWKRELVDFRKPVTVLGCAASDKARTVVDLAAQTGVYALYDGPELVYVGRAVRGKRPLGERLRAHHNDSQKTDRWITFSWFGFRSVNRTGELQSEKHAVRSVKTVEAAEIFEGLMIEFIRPRLNNRGGDLLHVDKYVQLMGEELVEDEE